MDTLQIMEGLDLRDSGIRSMAPSFLRNSRNITYLRISENENINTECHRLIEALHSGGSIDTLRLWNCNIDYITALDLLPLPHLRHLNLRSNKIDREGCKSIAKLLQKEGTRLNYRHLDYNDLGDDDAEALPIH